MSVRERRLIKNEHGGILVLAAMLIPVLLFFVALVVDTARVASTDSDKAHSADLVALAALESYLEASSDTSPASHAARMTAAISRAETIAEKNFSIFEERPQAAPGTLADESQGSVIPGRWWRSEPAACDLSGCPCDLDPAQPLNGCFQTCGSDGCVDPQDGAGRLLANAIRVELYTEGEGLRFFFTPKGAKSRSIYSAATAATQAKRGVVLFDLGRYTASETHPLFYKSGAATYPAAKEPSFELNSACPADGSNPCPSGPCPSILEGAYSTGNTYRTLYESIPEANRADYRCFNVTLNGTVKHFLLDVNSPARPYDQLRAALNGILDSFAADGAPEDELAIVGFEDAAPPPELQLPAGRFLQPASAAYAADLASLRAIAGDLNSAGAAGLFPKPNRGSDLVAGLQRARVILTGSPSFAADESFIILLTNGLSTCNMGACGTGVADNGAALSAVHDVRFAGGLKKDELRLHLYFAGAELKPHTSVVKKPQSDPRRCMTAGEKRAANYLEAFYLPSEESSFAAEFQKVGNGAVNAQYVYPAGALNKLVYYLEGNWRALRQPCPIGDARFSGSGEDFLCDVAADPPASLSNPTDTPNHTIRDSWSGLDSAGRLLCDSYRRGERQQAADYSQPFITKHRVLLVR